MTQATHEIYRINGKLDRVLANLKETLRQKKLQTRREELKQVKWERDHRWQMDDEALHRSIKQEFDRVRIRQGHVASQKFAHGSQRLSKKCQRQPAAQPPVGTAAI